MFGDAVELAWSLLLLCSVSGQSPRQVVQGPSVVSALKGSFCLTAGGRCIVLNSLSAPPEKVL